ncbi:MULTISPECIES: DUF2332 domain-containing protein [unclassified Sphingomonas]|uniref:DUF2332 domain-containing protein n=1 Tax=unclassified Sphingomonas TaxID=196159 RepID=UPI0006F8794C|nr:MULTISPECIES: DUF2332 family protein [unclassified Sphingomonas]KQM27649.1 hypothetical protein ASE58_04595 [Sphingomonas sp. Leaf9]KQM43989.1 hypothetical protein ASE57_04590 [Sphingomonas sp. Leaf11]
MAGPLARQAQVVRALGSPFVAAILDAGERQLHRAPLTARRIDDWPGDPAADALAMRFNGALHALARRGDRPALSTLYATRTGDFDGVIGDTMAQADAFIADWMREPPQTNEVARSAAIMAALMTLRADVDLPVELLELGASAGLNLNLGRYAFDLGGVRVGDAASPVRITPEWRGRPPLARPVEIVSARGVDLRPLIVGDPAAQERLMAYVWADQPERAERLRHALAIAHAHPPRVERDDIAHWLPQALSRPAVAGTCRVVVHAMSLQYCDAATHATVAEALATADTPIARIGFEWTEARDAVHLTLTTYPDGRTRHLATCHAYGHWIDWHGPTDG